LFQILKELKKDSHRASKGENESDVEEEAEEEQSEDGSQDSPSDFEPDGVPGEASVGHEGVTAKPPKKLPSSGSGRSKERAQMDLVNHEIHELEEQLKYHGVCLRPFSFHNLFTIFIGPGNGELTYLSAQDICSEGSWL
jgi:hypothetical protein